MSTRLSRLAILTSRALGTSTRPIVRSLPASLTKASTCQLRQITSSAIVREQYLHGYKDNERYHGKL